MNKSNINVPSAGTEADSNSTVQNQQVGQPNANTNVVGSREIKFRAWHKEYKKMLVVYVIHQGTYWEGFVKNCQGFVPPNEQYIFKFDEVEWMQYTGLKDKNGKEIYEGDIVVNMNRDLRLIKYSQNSFEMRLLDGNRESNQTTWYFTTEIVGNIFENPELLETLR